ncbi:fibrillarin-like rRNA/tRNA 2'-O-methyltransferase [Candidatus Bathyarchaeota archaeon]|nr:fibrillarin-like rRNA/tRNA 2'-O-methyltransferase [Candidatus Bathyarchaeota archaeon]
MSVKVEVHQQFPGIYCVSFEKKKLATKNLVPERDVYGERLVKYLDVEYRIWDSYRSKFAAAILNGLKKVPIQPNHKVLYLGAASGTTASHISDILGERGHMYCVEFAHRTIRELINNVCLVRSNMSPVLADARLPEQYLSLVEKVDDIYCDIAQPQQAKVLADNADIFLKAKGWVMLAIKARSIDVTKKPLDVYKQEIDTLKIRGFKIEDVVFLEPYDKAHAMVIGTWK